MRRKSGCQQQHTGNQRRPSRRSDRAVRRYLSCLRRPTASSDTDSDDVQLNNLLQGDDAEEQFDCSIVETALPETEETDTAQVSTYDGELAAHHSSTSETSCLLMHEPPSRRCALPLFQDHFRLPLFSGRHHWHAMFAQFGSSVAATCDADGTDIEEDILPDINFTSLFETTSPSVLIPGCLTDNLDQMDEERELSEHHLSVDSLDVVHISSQHNSLETDTVAANCEIVSESMLQIDTAQLSSSRAENEQNDSRSRVGNLHVEELHSVSLSGHVTDENESPEIVSTDAICSDNSETVEVHNTQLEVSEFRSHQRRERRHSDPSSSRSSRSGSRSGDSNRDNWYFYDQRLRPGGELAAHFSRLQTQRSLSAVIFPPAYDDIMLHSQSVILTSTTVPAAENCLMDTEDIEEELPPPPYIAPDHPPSYAEAVHERCTPWQPAVESSTSDMEQTSFTVDRNQSSREVTNASEANASSAEPCQLTPLFTYPTPQNRLIPNRCSPSPGLFGGRPAVRWNRNMRVERWTSSPLSWVA